MLIKILILCPILMTAALVFMHGASRVSEA